MKAGILYLFNRSGGFGMIAVDGGAEQVFLLHSDLEPGLLEKLRQGDRLEFDTIQDAKGLRAVHVKRVLSLVEEIAVVEKKKKPKASKKPAREAPKKRKK